MEIIFKKYCRLGCNAVQSVRWVPVFRMNLLPVYSW